MSQPIKQEFETHSPDAMGILLHYLSEVFEAQEVPILAKAKPALTAADRDIVERALGDGETTAVLFDSEQTNREFLGCVATYFNHLHYSDVLFERARVGQLIHDETEKLKRAQQDHARRLEAHTAALFRTRADDGRLELALLADRAAWGKMVACARADMETYRNEYSAAARRAGGLVGVVAELLDDEAILLKAEPENGNRG